MIHPIVVSYLGARGSEVFFVMWITKKKWRPTYAERHQSIPWCSAYAVDTTVYQRRIDLSIR